MDIYNHTYEPVAAQRTPVIIAGPCSAESRDQLLETAKRLSDNGIHILRAGIWKPRTMPGGFEGVGCRGLGWLTEARELTGMPVATEVATPGHVRAVVEAGIDMVWLGARTTTNPFAVQAVAETLAELAPDMPVLVKNPVNPDIDLWIGAIERLYRAGLHRLAAVHRGFTAYTPSLYRNVPQWQIPLELRRRMPGLPILHDPSHIGGRRDLIAPLASTAMAIGLDGLIVESHCDPDHALSDSRQQITPEQLRAILDTLVVRDPHGHGDDAELPQLRSRLDDIDTQLIELLASRMEVAREIGRYKRRHRMSVLQPQRYDALITSRVAQGEASGLSPEFVSGIMQLVHAESVARQTAGDSGCAAEHYGTPSGCILKRQIKPTHQ